MNNTEEYTGDNLTLAEDNAETQTTAQAQPAAPQDTAPGDEKKEPEVYFEDLDLSDNVLDALYDMRFEKCTPVQGRCIPPILEHHDVLGVAQTGTGKTAAFLVSVINDLLSNPIQTERFRGEPRALILAPTRELALQIESDAKELTKFTDLHLVT